jgi:tetratricopeptide (TPR) repeat protein
VNDIQSRLNQASGLLQASDAKGCVELCDEVLLQHPDLPLALHLRGVAAAQLGNRQQAITDLRKVWHTQKNNFHAALVLGGLLRQTGQYTEALAPLRAASSRQEFETDARYELGRVLTRLRKTDEALGEYKKILSRTPSHADAASNIAFLLERANRLEEAEQYASQALRSDPENTMALLSLATIERRNGFSQQAIIRLKPMLKRTLSPLNKSIVFNQLGQCHDDLGCWTEAFDCFRQSNETLKQHHPAGLADDQSSYGVATVQNISQWLGNNPPEEWSKVSTAGTFKPVFLVGFPRSGTTLLDQALSSHPDVEVLEEYEFFDAVRGQWTEQQQLKKIPTMTAADVDSARTSYLRKLNERRKLSDRPVVIDKLPLNLVYLFLIHRLFPDSLIVLAVRDPRDVCLSCYFQTFDLTGPMPYFLTLADTTNYYDKVMSLATETLKVIDNPQSVLRYETLVSQFEDSMRALIEFLGLEWSESIMDYRVNALSRHISTPSYQQVVKPLYTKSIGRWRNYQAHIESSLPALNQWIEYFSYTDN